MLTDSRALSGMSARAISPLMAIGCLPSNNTCSRTGASLSSRPPMQMMTIAECAKM
ncbi:Uncharacterised protein [Bordetella pertussis]|nr:Uncharacterised protein [Bordetella pertussis]CFW35813.1 Uncharacterised protein [Bordetella pertussis]